MDYLLLLRGVNVGGKHRMPMALLRDQLIQTGLKKPASYINSGNLFFTSDKSRKEIWDSLNQLFQSHYEFPVTFQIIDALNLTEIMAQSPTWWGQDSEWRHNTLFKLAGNLSLTN